MGLQITFKASEKTSDEKNERIKFLIEDQPNLLDYFCELLERIKSIDSTEYMNLWNTWQLVSIWELENCDDKQLTKMDIDFAIQVLSQEPESEESYDKLKRLDTIDKLKYLYKNFDWQKNDLIVNAWW